MDLVHEEMLEALEDMVNQHCSIENGELDSMALSANADAMRLLAKHNRIVITSEYGRRVIAKWPTRTG